MAKNKKNTNDAVEVTEDVVTTPTEETTETTTTEETSTDNTETVETETITPDGASTEEGSNAGAVEALGAVMSGIADQYNAQQETQKNLSDALDVQKKLFENFYNDIEAMKTTLTETQSSLTATKIYTQLLTKAIAVTDIIAIIAFILIIIFK